MKFEAVVQGKNGAMETVVRDARDKYDVAHLLRKEGHTVVAVNEARVRVPRNFTVAIPYFSKRISARDKILFAQNLASMIGAGLPLSRALAVMQKQIRSVKFREVLRDVLRAIDAGDSLHVSLSRYPDVFAEEFVAIVAAGEESGTLPQSLGIVGDQMDKAYSLKKKIRGAMMYPAVVVGAMVIIGIIMMTYVVPTMTTQFAEFGAELPFTTKIIIAVSAALSQHFFVTMVGLVFAVVGCSMWLKSPSGKRVYDTVSIRVPYLGGLAIEAQAAYTTRTLSSLISSGVDIVEGLRITRKVVSNTLHRELIDVAIQEVQRGATLSSIFRSNEFLYPPFVSAMIEVGEETGKLAEMMKRTALFYEDDVDTATKNLSTIVEPILMVIIGACVGFFALAIMQPLYSLGQNI